MIYNLRMLLRRNFSIVASKEVLHNTRDNLCKVEREPKEIKKSISVALIGKTNAGKSTLINAMMGMNICAVSVKPQTTVEYQLVFNVKDDTEIILLDTPGVISTKQLRRYRLGKETDVFKIEQLKAVDLVGVLVDVSDKYSKYIISSHVKRLMSTFPSKIEMVLILNKVDLIKDKFILLKCIDKMCSDLKLSKDLNLNSRVFTRIFMISALNNDGVNDLVEYIRSVAHEKENCKSSGKLSSHSDVKIVEQRVRAALLENLSYNIPYDCSYKVEYMKENVLGKLNIIANIICPKPAILKVVSKLSTSEKMIECEMDLEKVFGKPVFLKLQPVLQPNHKSKK